MLVRLCDVLFPVTIVWLVTGSIARLNAAEPDFRTEIAPLLAARCLECHSGNSPEGGLDLSTSSGVNKGGESGGAVQPGKPDDSVLWQRIRDDEMPPKHLLTAE